MFSYTDAFAFYLRVNCFRMHINVFVLFVTKFSIFELVCRLFFVSRTWEKYLICFFCYSGVVLNHLGHVGGENMPFCPNNGIGDSLHQMEGSVMVVPGF